MPRQVTIDQSELDRLRAVCSAARHFVAVYDRHESTHGYVPTEMQDKRDAMARLFAAVREA